MRLLAAGLLGLIWAGRALAHGGHHTVHSRLKTGEGDRKGILLIHFGTSREEARGKALDAIKGHVTSHFPDYQVREAYTSRMVIKKIESLSGERFLTPEEALKGMADEGFTHVVVQASHVINGLEAQHLAAEVAEFTGSFKDIRMGTPLLSSPEDYMEVADIFHKRYPEKNILLVGHGTPHHAGSAYGMLQYIAHRRGYKNIFIGTVEGYPGLDEVILDLEGRGIQHVTLVPLMVVAGVHAEEDIAGEWRETLEKKGFSVEVSMEGMGEIPEIQHLLIHHLEDAISHIPEDLAGRKKNILREAV